MKRFFHPLTIACCLLLLAEMARAQCSTGLCGPPATPPAAVARVVATTADGRSLGSGTLVHRDQQRGIVLTCAHLFEPRPDSLVVIFPNGHRADAVVVKLDRTWDLAALEIARPDVPPMAIAADHPRLNEPLRSCGYGGDGRYWINDGRAMGYLKMAGGSTHETLQLSGFARDGDSGGPVLNARGELTAVLWGTDGRRVVGTYCGRIRKFLADVLAMARHVPAGAPSVPTDPSPRGPSEFDDFRSRLDGLARGIASLDDQRSTDEQRNELQMGRLENSITLLAALGERLKTIESAIASRGRQSGAATVNQTPAPPSSSFVQTVLPPALAALGWTGPPSILGILALRLAASLLRRRAAKRANKQDGHVLAEHLNDDYAAQLAGVYALSGRSPMADVTLGREYDQELEQAATGSDVALARWARELRQRVARRLYRIHAASPVPSEPTTTETHP